MSDTPKDEWKWRFVPPGTWYTHELIGKVYVQHKLDYDKIYKYSTGGILEAIDHLLRTCWPYEWRLGRDGPANIVVSVNREGKGKTFSACFAHGKKKLWHALEFTVVHPKRRFIFFIIHNILFLYNRRRSKQILTISRWERFRIHLIYRRVSRKVYSETDQNGIGSGNADKNNMFTTLI